MTQDNSANTIDSVLEKFPFLSYGTMLDVEYLGIIQNSDSQLLSMYILSAIPTNELRAEFLRLGFSWWWESNRSIPINIFLKDRFLPFRPYIKHLDPVSPCKRPSRSEFARDKSRWFVNLLRASTPSSCPPKFSFAWTVRYASFRLTSNLIL
jgi:hypothetical protein